MEKSTSQVLILGAGVSGLSTGIVLQQHGYNTTIWAKDLPPHTTSNKAAAFWYPHLSGPIDKVTQWSKITFQVLTNKYLNDPNSGCIKRTVVELFDHKRTEEPSWKGSGPIFRRPRIDSLPTGYVDGYETETVVIDTSLYMNYLMHEYQKAGGTLLQKSISDIYETFAFPVVVNCTGLGSRTLFNDYSLYPVRGQMVRIKPNGFDRILVDGEGHNSIALIVPRINDVMLGTTSQENNWNLDVDVQDREDILRHCAALSPLFQHVEILSESVGLRPARPEIRLELEHFNTTWVIHNYGHGGSGFTVSWGCAEDVFQHVSTIVSL